MNSISIPPDSVHVADDAWEWVETTEDYVTWRAPLERFGDGRVAYVYRKEPRGLAGFLEANKQALSESETTKARFGEGKIIASIPLNEFFREGNQIAEKIREGDKDHLKWFLNSDDARPFRKFRGRI